MKTMMLRNSICAALMTATVFGGFTAPALAATPSDQDLEAQIQEQERILAELNNKKKEARTDALQNQITSLSSQLEDLKKNSNNKYDAKGAIDALAGQIASLQEELDTQSEAQEKLLASIEKLNKMTTEMKNQQEQEDRPVYTYRSHSSSDSLVNPGPRGNVSYTQDAKNAQGNSTMLFAYAPDQIYKIYCRTGYLTDIVLKKGEKVSFIGGGDTSSWAVNSTTVDGTPHIYIKPVVQTSTTNLIITTDKRSYQLILNTSDWYNPMVKWTYGQEEAQAAFYQKQKDEQTITTKVSTSIDKLNFDYKVKVKGSESYKPSMVFDDGEKTVIKFSKSASKLPALFIKEKGHKEASMANFTIKDNCYIIDRVIDRAELRYSDTDIITITRND